MDPEVWKFVLGGGGGVGLIAAVLTYLKDHRRDRVLDEDTALKRLYDDYERKKNEAKRLERELNWYRYNYPLLWSAWAVGPPPGKGDFPSAPPHGWD